MVSNNVANLEKIHYEGMSEVILQDLLPKDLGFDMNMHILFRPRRQPRLHRDSRAGAWRLHSQRCRRVQPGQ